MNTRTICQFGYQGDVISLVEQWAHEFDYRYITTEGSARIYQRGKGFWTAPMRVQVEQQGKQVTLQAWAYAPLLNRLMALFLVPEEMEIKSGGVRMVIPRSMARKDFNILLGRLGQPPIE